jgi:HK97 family phage major capsid protein
MDAPITGPTTPPAAPPPPQKTDAELLEQFIKGQQQLKEDTALLAKKAAGEAVKESVGELVERIAKTETGITGLVTKYTELARRSSRPPGSGPEGDRMSLGQSMTQCDAFKNNTLSGRFKIEYTHRGRLEMRAAPPVTEAASPIIIPPRVAWVQAPRFPLVMRDLIDVIPITGTNAVEYVTEAWTDAADYQGGEGVRKAQSGVVYTGNTALTRTIAHFIKVSRQMLSDVPSVQSSIDSRLIYGVLAKEDKEILLGDGTANHLNGILTQATAISVPAGITALVTTLIDAILAAITQLANTGRMATAAIMTPTDWAGIQLAKTTQGNYIMQGPGYGPPQVGATPTLWGIPVLPDINMTPGKFLVGAFPGNVAIFDRESATIEISFENEDDFVNNLATIRCEERIALAVYVPAAFIKGNTVSPFLAPLENPPEPPTHHTQNKR